MSEGITDPLDQVSADDVPTAGLSAEGFALAKKRSDVTMQKTSFVTGLCNVANN